MGDRAPALCGLAGGQPPKVNIVMATGAWLTVSVSDPNGKIEAEDQKNGPTPNSNPNANGVTPTTAYTLSTYSRENLPVRFDDLAQITAPGQQGRLSISAAVTVAAAPPAAPHRCSISWWVLLSSNARNPAHQHMQSRRGAPMRRSKCASRRL